MTCPLDLVVLLLWHGWLLSSSVFDDSFKLSNDIFIRLRVPVEPKGHKVLLVEHGYEGIVDPSV
jgi:hypothetical protein